MSKWSWGTTAGWGVIAVIVVAFWIGVYAIVKAVW